MKNKKGFTLVELLAAMIILGLILGVAVPNVIKILDNSRNDAYINDAKNLLSLAEYKYRSGKGITRPSGGTNCIIMSLEYLDNSEFEHAPHGGKYDKKRSYVAIRKGETSTEYYATLAEEISTDKYQGLQNRSILDLNEKDRRDFYIVKKSINDFPEIEDITEIKAGYYTICNNIVEKY